VADGLDQFGDWEGNVPKLFFPAIFDPSVDRLIGPRKPLGPKMPLWKAVAFAGGLGLSMLSYPVHALTANGGDIVQSLWEACSAR
jgi:hypothetical protein